MANEPETVEADIVRVTPSTVAAITRSEIESQIEFAIRFPRRIEHCRRQAIELACLDRDTARACIYTLSRQEANGHSKQIVGPSIRMMEIIRSCWRNIRTITRIVDEGDRFITAMAVCMDLETNVVEAREVRRRITRRDGTRYGDDMIGVTANAAASIALRNAIKSCIPEALWKPVFEAARLSVVGNAASLAERRKTMMEEFGKLGATPEQLLAFLKHTKLTQVTLDDLAVLAGIWTKIHDGDSTIEQEFSTEPAENGKPQVDRLMAKATGIAGPIKAELPAEAPAPEASE